MIGKIILIIVTIANKLIRTTEVAKELKTTNGNVSQALKKLKKDKLIDYKPYQNIKLTDKALIIGKESSEKHEIAEQFVLRHLDTLDHLSDVDIDSSPDRHSGLLMPSGGDGFH